METENQNNPELLWALSGAFVLTFVYYFLNEEIWLEGSVFPLMIVHPEVESINIQTYVDYAMWRALLCVVVYYVWANSPIYRGELRCFFWLFVGYTADYFLTFNQPLTYAIPWEFVQEKPKYPGFYVPLGYPLFMLIFMITLTFRSWKQY